ncbi:Prolyl 4-hydroxylase subunit alpha-2, partial [Orchesella cincta]
LVFVRSSKAIYDFLELLRWFYYSIIILCTNNVISGVSNWIEGFRKGTNFPQADDLNGAAQALVRLQDTYQLDMPSLAQGNVMPSQQLSAENEQAFQSTSQLSARDMLFMGRHALSQGLYHRAIDWLQHAELLANGEMNSSSVLSEISPSLQNAIEAHDDVLERQGPRGVSWKTNPIPINPALANSAKYSLNTSTTFHVKLYQRQTEEEEAEHFLRLCRGENIRVNTCKVIPSFCHGIFQQMKRALILFQPPVLTAALKCRLKTDTSPYLLISPLKIEEQSHDPYVVIVHDFITSSQADEIIKLGKPKLFRSRHRHHQDEVMDVVSHKRVSQNAWIKDWEHPLMHKVTRRVYLVTGLKAIQPKEAEDYQIANYGLGGLYVPHTDHLMNNPDKSIYSPWERFVGDRIATLMIYLSDVDGGGATVFTRAGVTLWPEKGAAAFWWNLDKSGIGDDNTRHGACPVLHGNKWVSNKWIRFNEQFNTAPCGRHPLDKHKRP